MSAGGLGVGGYGNCTGKVDCNVRPLCFHSDVCFVTIYNAVKSYLALPGGVRIDGANNYENNDAVGKAIKDSKRNRSEIFLVEKIGPHSYSLGYNDAHK